MSEIADDGTGRKAILDHFSFAAAKVLADASGSVPAKLYHFTDANGMSAIVQSGKLRSTLATGLNDRSELRYGVEVLRNLLNAGGSSRGELYDRFCVEVGKKLSVDQMQIPGQGPFLPFVTSFCEQENVAVQWLHYGRDGTGSALAFEGGRLAQAPWALRPVFYDAAKQRPIVESLLDAAWTALDQLAERNLLRPLEVAYLVEAAATYLWEVAVCIKHASFADEREWRLYTIETIGEMNRDLAEQMKATLLPMNFRICSGRVVPYVEILYKSLPLVEIILGASDPHLDDDPGLRFLLERSKLSTVKIRRSDVPVRP